MAFLDWFQKTSLPDDWQNLESEVGVDEILADRRGIPHIIFKHSTRCGISEAMLEKFVEGYLEQSDPSNKVKVHYLDLIANRSTSNFISEKTGVVHQSPQVIVIRNGKVIDDFSHHAITFDRVLSSL